MAYMVDLPIMALKVFKKNVCDCHLIGNLYKVFQSPATCSFFYSFLFTSDWKWLFLLSIVRMQVSPRYAGTGSDE